MKSRLSRCCAPLLARHLGQDDAAELATASTATEVTRLLNLGARGQARIGEHAIEGSDIAILVRTHRQGRQMQEALRERGIASIQLGAGNVFESREAMELERLLQAVAEPGIESHLKAALVTEMLGKNGNELFAMSQDEATWEGCLMRFQGYHARWRNAGFMPMFRELAEHEGAMARLLGFPDGERRLTNLLHLAELVEAQASRSRWGMERLARWLGEQRLSPPAGDEAALLRLESDEHLVKIVTVHASKGLEYPIVFCPFLWDGRDGPDGGQGVLYHAPAENYGAVLDLGTPRQDEARGLARREGFAEDLRLLYVALTRAKHRCYFVWGCISQVEKSAPSWLLHPPPEPDLMGLGRHTGMDCRYPGDKDVTPPIVPNAWVPAIPAGTTKQNPTTTAYTPDVELERLYAHVKGLGEVAMWADIERLAAESEGAIVVERLAETIDGEFYRPAQTASETLSAREFRSVMPAAWRVTSFTGLTSGISSDQPDYDARARGFELPEIPKSTRDIFTFPRGARAGRALHAIFEELDFARYDQRSLDSLTAQSLAAHGIGVEWTEVVGGHIARVLETPLDLQGKIRLRDIPNQRRLNELEFHFPIARIDPQSLQRVMGGFISLPNAITPDCPVGEIRCTTPFVASLSNHERPFDKLRANGSGTHEESGITMNNNLNFSPVHGFMKGFIDLVFECDGKFYVADYKNNWLGPAAEDYQAGKLTAAMTEEGYTLQYLLYSVAVHRYLRSRLPDYRYETHFGGVFYLFLRGMDPALGPQCGVFWDRPEAALIEALDQYFAGEHAHA